MGEWVAAAFSFSALLVGMSAEGAWLDSAAGTEKGRRGMSAQSPERGVPGRRPWQRAGAQLIRDAHWWAVVALAQPGRGWVQVPFRVCWRLAG